MAVRKSRDDKLVVDGDRTDWIVKVKAAMDRGGFNNVTVNDTLYLVKGDYHKATTWGVLEVTLVPAGERTELAMKATANADNVFALFKSPTQKIVDAFRNSL